MNTRLSFRSGNRNTWIYIAIAALVIVGLLLPPVSLAERLGITCSGINLNANSLATTTADGLTLALSDSAQSLTVKLQSVEAAQFDANEAGDDLAKAREALPVNLLLRSPIYQIQQCGQSLVSASLAINLPNGAGSNTTFDLYAWDGKDWTWLGAYLDPTSNTVSAQVEVLPKQVALFETTSMAPYVAAQIVPGQTLPADAVSLLNEVYVNGWSLSTDGTLVADAGSLPNTGKAKIIPVVRADDPNLVSNLIGSEDSLKAHIATLIELAGRSSFAGLGIDYRDLPQEQRANFTHFVQQLAQAVHDQDKLLTVVLPAPAIDATGAPDTAGYDWLALGAAADVVQSDFGKDPGSYLAGNVAYALVNWAPTQVNRYKFQPIISLASLDTVTGGQPNEVSFADAIKPLGQLKMTGPLTVTAGTSVTLALDNPTQVSNYKFDNQTLTYRFSYGAAGQQHDVMVNTAASFAQRLNLLLPQRMRGVVISGLSGDVLPLALNQALTGYRQQSVPSDLPSALDMQWTVSSSTGKEVLKSQRPITDTTIAFAAPNEPGTYNIVAMIGTQSKGSGVMLVAKAVTTTAEITSTTTTTDTTAAANACFSSKYLADVTIPDGTKLKNTEAFTKTWRIRNDGTCNWTDDTVLVYVSGTKMGSPDSVTVGKVVSSTDVEVSIPLTAPDQYGNYTGLWQLKNAQGNFGTQLSAVIQAGDPPPGTVLAAASPPVVAPGAIGSFELGGQINSFRRPDLMKKAGMSWIKVQSHGGDESGAIANAHAQGFKILLSVLGDKGGAMDPNYQDKYAKDLANMARAGADAIEVWNEPNIDREWPSGQINGGNYTALLAKAYNAIKAANPGTMVVSAAPAPTGFFQGGCQAGGCNDDVFLQQMAAAGAANYMDCVGAHHNSGTTSPSVTSGRPEGDHYSWYFLPTLNLYYSAFGGARKVCFTELGYLSPQGYPSLQSTAPAFAWAENTTVAQQAQWLAEAATLSINSGKVRLMIIFNVDFDYYGSDPQAGYAIIRPGDSCPACDSLGAVVGSR
jgi:hypothetical protein